MQKVSYSKTIQYIYIRLKDNPSSISYIDFHAILQLKRKTLIFSIRVEPSIVLLFLDR